MKTFKIRKKSIEEIIQELESLYKELFKLRMQHATSQLSRSSELRRVRRNIARMKTILNEKK